MSDYQDEEIERFLGSLESIRTYSQCIRNLLLDFKDSYTKLDSNSINDVRKVFEFNKEEINKNIEKINPFNIKDSGLYMDHNDTIAKIKSNWNSVNIDITNIFSLATVSQGTGTPAPVVAGSPNIPEIIDKCTDNLCKLIKECNRETIPNRTNRHLETSRVGYEFPYYEIFKDQVCSHEEAEDILKNMLLTHPEFINGIIDSEKGVIFKVDPPEKRWKSYMYITLGIIGGGLVTGALLAKLFLPPDTQFAQYFLKILELFVIAFAGAVTHVAIDALKEIRSSDPTHFRALDDIPLWINVKQLPILAGIVVLCVGFIVTFNLYPVYNPLTFFIAGYSIDSLGDLYIQRFETTMTSKVEEIKKNLSPS
jgi:hypothetical protein